MAASALWGRRRACRLHLGSPSSLARLSSSRLFLIPQVGRVQARAERRPSILKRGIICKDVTPPADSRGGRRSRTSGATPAAPMQAAAHARWRHGPARRRDAKNFGREKDRRWRPRWEEEKKKNRGGSGSLYTRGPSGEGGDSVTALTKATGAI